MTTSNTPHDRQPLGRSTLQDYILCSRLGSQLRANLSKWDRAAPCRINRPTLCNYSTTSSSGTVLALATILQPRRCGTSSGNDKNQPWRENKMNTHIEMLVARIVRACDGVTLLRGVRRSKQIAQRHGQDWPTLRDAAYGQARSIRERGGR